MNESKRTCLVCNTEQKFIFKVKDFSFCRCTICGLVSTYPFPESDTIEEHYRKGFNEGNYRLRLEYSKEYASVYNADIKILQHRLKSHNLNIRGLKVLDIGCFTGVFLELLQDRGADVYGLELQSQAVEIANRKMPGRIFKADYSSNDFPQIQFDVITMFSLMEHVVDPIKLLKRSTELLKSNGILMMQTQDPNTLIAKIMGKYWLPYIPVEHFHYFSRNAFGKILSGLGYEDITFKQQWKRLPIDYVYKMFQTFSPISYKLLKPLFKVLPQSIAGMSLPFYIGGVTVMARKS